MLCNCSASFLQTVGAENVLQEMIEVGTGLDCCIALLVDNVLAACWAARTLLRMGVGWLQFGAF